MVQGDLLRKLFRSFAVADEEGFLSAAHALIGEERAKNHRLLADDLERLLLTRNGKAPKRAFSRDPEIPRDSERGFPLIEVESTEFEWSRLIVGSKTSRPLELVAEEHRRIEVLSSAGLKPTRRMLFYGPPGCGKTLAAKVLAGVLGYPLVTVRFDSVVSSFLGETAANLRRVFDFVSTFRCVALFDEFDAIGKDRDNEFEHGELKRVVNSLLQFMDAYKGESLLIAATNHEGLLDSAVLRRFEAVVEFGYPKPQDRVLLLRLFLRAFSTTRVELDSLARKLECATGADIENIATAAARIAVLSGRCELIPSDFTAGVELFYERLKLRESISSPRLAALQEDQLSLHAQRS
jgi:hypothetical protein